MEKEKCIICKTERVVSEFSKEKSICKKCVKDRKKEEKKHMIAEVLKNKKYITKSDIYEGGTKEFKLFSYFKEGKLKEIIECRDFDENRFSCTTEILLFSLNGRLIKKIKI